MFKQIRFSVNAIYTIQFIYRERMPQYKTQYDAPYYAVFNILFLSTHKLYSSLRLGDQVSDPWSAAD